MTTELLMYFSSVILEHLLPLALDKHTVSVPALGRFAGEFFIQVL